MDLYKIIATLYEEKKRLDRLIDNLEKLKAAGGVLDSRKPKKRRGRKNMSVEERQRVSERMRQYWASRRAQQASAAAASQAS